MADNEPGSFLRAQLLGANADALAVIEQIPQPDVDDWRVRNHGAHLLEGAALNLFVEAQTMARPLKRVGQNGEVGDRVLRRRQARHLPVARLHSRKRTCRKARG